RASLIGPNGAGKTTVINLLPGVLRPSAGRILLEGEDITLLEAYKRVRRGLARTFQINQLFLDLTPLESVGLAIAERMGAGAQWWRLVGSTAAGGGGGGGGRAHRHPHPRQPAPGRDRPRHRLPAARAAARRAGGRRARGRTPRDPGD